MRLALRITRAALNLASRSATTSAARIRTQTQCTCPWSMATARCGAVWCVSACVPCSRAALRYVHGGWYKSRCRTAVLGSTQLPRDERAERGTLYVIVWHYRTAHVQLRTNVQLSYHAAEAPSGLPVPHQHPPEGAHSDRTLKGKSPRLSWPEPLHRNAITSFAHLLPFPPDILLLGLSRGPRLASRCLKAPPCLRRAHIPM